MSSSTYSICIPHVYNNISDKKIYDVFSKYKLGTVSSIDMKRRTGTDKHLYKTVFVHFSEWNVNSISAMNLKNMIDDPTREAKLVYDDPWYWVLLPNNTTGNKTFENTSRRNTSHTVRVAPTMKNKKMTIEHCYSRITMLEHELTRLYKKISRRVYPETSMSSNSDVTPINTASYPMTIDELSVDINTDTDSGELHKHPRTISSYSDESDLTSDCDDEYYSDFENNDNDTQLYYGRSRLNEKVWMTSNVCGNN